MGRGSSKAKGYVAKGELKLPDGSKIEFDGELRYGDKDKTVTGAVRQNIESWENRRRKNKIEYAYSVDRDGNPVGPERKGGSGSVRTPYSYHGEGTTFTHIHPRGAGILGGTFSEGDLQNFAYNRGVTSRAAAKEGTYSISKGPNFDSKGFMQYVRQVHRDIDSSTSAQAKAVTKQARDGKITHAETMQQLGKISNNHLIALHNKYLEGQKKYGYIYTLEQI